jgi:hypothetical protein
VLTDLKRTPTLKQVEDKKDDSENKKDVDPGTESGTTDQANDPEKKKNDSNRPEHLSKSPVAGPLSRPGVVVLDHLPSIRCEV